MDEGTSITPELASQVIERLWLRSWLYAMLCLTIGFCYPSFGNPIVEEMIFFVLGYFAFFLIAFAILYRNRYKRGVFGSSEGDQKLIAAWLEKANHWWEKPLIRTSFTAPR